MRSEGAFSTARLLRSTRQSIQARSLHQLEHSSTVDLPIAVAEQDQLLLGRGHSAKRNVSQVRAVTERYGLEIPYYHFEVGGERDEADSVALAPGKREASRRDSAENILLCRWLAQLQMRGD